MMTSPAFTPAAIEQERARVLGLIEAGKQAEAGFHAGRYSHEERLMAREEAAAALTAAAPALARDYAAALGELGRLREALAEVQVRAERSIAYERVREGCEREAAEKTHGGPVRALYEWTADYHKGNAASVEWITQPIRAALTAPAPAEAELRAEVERLEGLLRLAGPALRAAQTYHYKRAHAAHALPGSRDRAGYEIEANEALFRLRLDSAQKGAAAVLEALNPKATP